MMSSSSRKGFEVFDFKADDEVVESLAGRFMGKFRSPKSDTSPLTKYNFLQTFASRTCVQRTESSDVPCLDIDATYGNHGPNNHGSFDLGTSVGDCAITEITSVKKVIPVFSHGKLTQTNPHTAEPELFLPGCSSVDSLAPGSANPLATEARFEVSSTGKKQLNCSTVDPPSNNDLVDVFSDDDESVAHSPGIGEDQGSLEGSSSDHCSSGWEIENIDAAVVVDPDYLIYGDRYSTESSLTFNSSCIKLEGTNAYGSKESFSSEWGIDGVIGIESLWYPRVETALVKLSIRLTTDGEAENPDGSFGIVELKFAVCDPSWSESQEKIMSMDARYRAAWRVLLGTDEKDGDGFVGKNRKFGTNRYFPNFDEPFEDVVYPKGDPDAVSISKRDVELLQPETFINDTIIDFYIKYLKNKIVPQNRHRFHFFNSFFFRKLADLDKDPASASEGRAAFLRVRKWTRKVNLFEKDFVFIPVNFNLHWSLLIVCHPGGVASFRDEEIDKSPKVPCILHMDSIKGSHKGLKNLVQSYLWEEWKERHEESSEDVSSKFLNLRFVALEVPQQENSFDCGLFLLHFVELFLEEAPVYFSPFKITKFSNFLNMDWFPPAEASLKRAFIQKLIYELLEHDSQKRLPAACSDEYHCSQSLEKDNDYEHGIEFHLERHSPARACYGYPSCSTADQGIEIKLLTASPGGSQCPRDSELVFRELLEPGSSAESLPDGQFLPHDQLTSIHKFKAVMSPVKEDEESGEQFAFTPSGRAVSSSPTGTSANAYMTSCASKGFTLFDSMKSGISMQQDEQYSDCSSPEASSLGSQSSSEVMVDERLSPRGFVYPNEQKAEELRSASPENVGCITGSPASACSDKLETCIVEDSQEVDRIAENDENNDSLSTCPESLLAPSYHNQTDPGENRNNVGGHMQLSVDDVASEAEEGRATKRIRLMPEVRRRCTRSVTKDGHS